MAPLFLYLLVTLVVLAFALPADLHAVRGKGLVVAAVMLVLPLGQARQDHLLYPADHWGMYTSPDVPLTFQEYVVGTVAGASYHYPFVQVAFSSPRTFMARLSQLITRCRCKEGDALLDAIFEALVSIHRDRSGAAVARLTVYDNEWSSARRTIRYRWQPHTAGADNDESLERPN